MNDTNDMGVPAPEGIVDSIDTDYEIGQDNVEGQVGPYPFDIHNPVFGISAGIIIAFVLFTMVFPETASWTFDWLFGFVTQSFDWFFLTAGNILVLFCIGLIFSPLGSVRLGGDESTPDFGYVGWFAMLFAAGMGIGLMFYGVGEPLTHFGTAMTGTTVEDGLRTDWAPLGGAAGDAAAAERLAMAATIYHWGLHPWAIYAVLALALALFSYNKGLPLSVRSAFYPILGERVWGWWGHTIDTIAVFATLFGLATSLGIGSAQANAGLSYLFGLPSGVTTQVILIVFITGFALLSVVRGLEGGVKILSEVNMGLALLLLTFVFFVGPTADLVAGFFANFGAYAEYIPALSMPFGREDTNFVQGWTSYYWAWWISWSPFVGMFIARVSRGRTVREFLICVLIIPSVLSIIWMTVFGQTAINQVVEQGYQAAVEAELPLQMFRVFDELPLAGLTSLVGIALVIIFFVTSSDSGSLVIDTITAGGKTDAPVPQRVFWATFEGLVAIVLLLAGGLAALQSMVISTGLIFAVILLILCWTILSGLRDERRALK